MATKGDAGRKPPSRKPKGSPEKPKTESELVNEAIKEFEQKLKEKEIKPTVGDFIRLLQLKKELKADEPREIKVSWVEPGEPESATEK